MAESFLQRQQRIMSGQGQAAPPGFKGGQRRPPGYSGPAPVGGGGQRMQSFAQPQGANPRLQSSVQGDQRLQSSVQGGANPRLQSSVQGAPQGTAAAGANASPTTYSEQQFRDWQTQRYGRGGSAADMQRIATRIGAPGANGQYSQQQWDTGQQESDTIARGYGWNGPALAQQPGQASPAVDPQPGQVGHTGRVAVDPGEGYQAQQLEDFQGPNTGQVEQLNTQLMERILQNPESLGEDQRNQMYAASRDQAMSQAQQLRGDAAAQMANRGFSGGGGMQASANAAVDQNMLSELLNANRNTDVGAAQQNFQDRLNVAGAGSQFQNDAMQRALGNYGANAQQFGLNEGARQAQSQDQLGRDQFRADQMFQDRGNNLQEYLGREGVSLDNRRFGEQQRQFNQTFGFDVTRFLDDMRRDNRNFGEGSRQFNVGSGLNTAQLQQQANNSLLQWLQQAGM